MNAGDYFRLVDELPVRDWRELTGGRPFLVLSPHPDDESLGAGGLIALARQYDQEVAVVLVTDGSKSHPNSPTYPRDRLIAIRRAELVEAVEILGLKSTALFELGLPDAAAPMEGPAFDRAVDVVRDIVESARVQSVFVTWGQDPHCDHEAAARLAEELCRRDPTLKLWSYPVWGWHLPPDRIIPAPPPAGMRIAIDSVLDRKRAAIEAHRSQMTDMIDDDPDGFRFTAATLAPFLRPFEFYMEAPVR